MWLSNDTLEKIDDILFYANTPYFIAEKLRKLKILEILEFSHNDKNILIDEINGYMGEIATEKYYFSYVYTLLLYLETAFEPPFIVDIDYSMFTYLSFVIQIFNNGTKETYHRIEVIQPVPQVKILTL